MGDFNLLPDHVMTDILGLLDWHSRINMQSTCRRLKTLVDDGPWTRRARFTLNDLPTVFTTVTSQTWSDSITELDVNHYVLANSDRLAAGIGRCKNLIVLRCLHCRLIPATLFLLVRNNLPVLESLYWSVLEEPTVGFPAPPDIAPEFRERDGMCAIVPATLTRMYIEAVNAPASIAFVESALRHCQSLRFLHFHEHESLNPVPDAAGRILHAIRSGTLDDFQDLTYTCGCVLTYELPPAYPSPLQGNLFGNFGMYVDVYKNVTLNFRPERSCNCVTIAELEFTSGIKSHKQLTVLISEGGEETISRLVRATRSGTCRHLKAITLLSVPEASEMFCSGNIRNKAALCNFICTCVALTELNLSVFHFSKDFNCCSVIATGGLENLRALAIAPCALCNPGSLELLSRASFKLRELDIRSDISLECNVCDLKTTCDDASLASLRLLRHLTRLTLCELYRARSLDFLVGCASLLHLRLRNMGIWRLGSRQDMSPIAGLWTQLRSLKMESIFAPIDFAFIINVPVSPTLSRLCLGTVIRKELAGDIIPSKLQAFCPAANVIHLHAWQLGEQLEQEICVLNSPFTEGDEVEAREERLFVSPVDKAWLCTCNNTIGIPKQYGIN